MKTSEVIEIVHSLQRMSANTFVKVISSLQVGMSESDIAELMRLEFKLNSINEFWYNIPQNVLIGTERFKEGTISSDYTIKGPSKDVLLKDGDTVFIDFSPMDPETKQWGDWSSTIIFHPRKDIDGEQASFLHEMRQIHREGIKKINAKTTGADVANCYLEIFRKREITLLDVRNNVGHSLHTGLKNKVQRIWLDENNNDPLGEGFYAVEPGGFRPKVNGTGFIVGRFEESIYIPRKGNAVILGNKEYVPLIV